MKAVGVNPDTNLVEAVEVENHPWFVGAVPSRVQEHRAESFAALRGFREAALAYAEKSNYLLKKKKGTVF